MDTSPRREGEGVAGVLVDALPRQRLARCPLYRARVNTWVLRRTLRDKPSDAEIAKGAAEVVCAWFEPTRYWGAQWLAPNVLRVARRKPLELERAVARADTITPRPLLLGDCWASCLVEFLYWGDAAFCPWLMRTADGKASPENCVWALAIVGAPRDY